MNAKQEELLKSLIPIITKDISKFVEIVVEKRLTLFADEVIKCDRERQHKKECGK